MKTYFYAKAITYRNILDLISRYTLDFPDIETGGDLFGFWTHSGCPVVQVITGPGEKARHGVVSFHQDVDYLKSVHAVLNQQHGLQHLGAWHSHHKLDLARPSGYDISTARAGLEQGRLERLLVVISNIRDEDTEVNAFLFRKKEKAPYIPLAWTSFERENPYYHNSLPAGLITPPVGIKKEPESTLAALEMTSNVFVFESGDAEAEPVHLEILPDSPVNESDNTGTEPESPETVPESSVPESDETESHPNTSLQNLSE